MSSEHLTLPRSILIVDDDQNLRRSLSLILRRAGYLVESVGQACEALQHLQVGAFNLIIMDLTTPENRLTLLPAILCMYPHLSVLVFTALWSPETTLEIGKLKVQGHLEKPVTPGQLLDQVEAILAIQL